MSTIATSRSRSVRSTAARRAAPPSAPSSAVARRLRALAAAGFSLEALPAKAVRIDLGQPSDPSAAADPLLAACLLEGGLPARADREAGCRIDAAALLPLASEAGAALGLALFLVSGARGRAFPRGADAGSALASGALGLAAAGGLSARECRLVEDRLLWLAANAVLIAPPGAAPSVWLRRLAAAFRLDFGEPGAERR